MKSLFIPLKTEHYDAFANGSKRIEYRKLGSRWNEKTCSLGRHAILSKGYGKKSRLAGIILKTEIIRASHTPEDLRASLKKIYGNDDYFVIAIHIGAIKPVAQP